MNATFIGPEESGKSTLALNTAKRIARGRPIYIVSEDNKSPHPSVIPITIEQFHEVRNAVVIVDDTTAFLETYDLMKKDNKLKAPVVRSRWRNRVNMFVFHTADDAIKFFLRNSRYIYISEKINPAVYKNVKELKGIKPEIIGRNGFTFLRFKRY